jgi:hypothetical protein
MTEEDLPLYRRIRNLHDEWCPSRVQVADHFEQRVIPSIRGEEIVGDHKEEIAFRRGRGGVPVAHRCDDPWPGRVDDPGETLGECAGRRVVGVHRHHVLN